VCTGSEQFGALQAHDKAITTKGEIDKYRYGGLNYMSNTSKGASPQCNGSKNHAPYNYANARAPDVTFLTLQWNKFSIPALRSEEYSCATGCTWEYNRLIGDSQLSSGPVYGKYFDHSMADSDPQCSFQYRSGSFYSQYDDQIEADYSAKLFYKQERSKNGVIATEDALGWKAFEARVNDDYAKSAPSPGGAKVSQAVTFGNKGDDAMFSRNSVYWVGNVKNITSATGRSKINNQVVYPNGHLYIDKSDKDDVTKDRGQAMVQDQALFCGPYKYDFEYRPVVKTAESYDARYYPTGRPTMEYRSTASFSCNQAMQRIFAAEEDTSYRYAPGNNPWQTNFPDGIPYYTAIVKGSWGGPTFKWMYSNNSNATNMQQNSPENLVPNGGANQLVQGHYYAYTQEKGYHLDYMYYNLPLEPGAPCPLFFTHTLAKFSTGKAGSNFYTVVGSEVPKNFAELQNNVYGFENLTAAVYTEMFNMTGGEDTFMWPHPSTVGKVNSPIPNPCRQYGSPAGDAAGTTFYLTPQVDTTYSPPIVCCMNSNADTDFYNTKTCQEVWEQYKSYANGSALPPSSSTWLSTDSNYERNLANVYTGKDKLVGAQIKSKDEEWNFANAPIWMPGGGDAKTNDEAVEEYCEGRSSVGSSTSADCGNKCNLDFPPSPPPV